MDGKGGNGDITYRLFFYKFGLKRKERVVVGIRSIIGLRKCYYFVLLLFVFKDGRDFCVFRGWRGEGFFGKGEVEDSREDYIVAVGFGGSNLE